ncbi:MAG TPA: hypothetical protein VJL89_10125 [Thermodesulfovibrionia bacterium]|nr:hypothetical protein [Thermodesulfovibrionia bacterium]
MKEQIKKYIKLISKKNYTIVNLFTFSVSIILIILGISYKDVAQTILLSTGCSILAASIISYINTEYIFSISQSEFIAAEWGLKGIYEKTMN